MNKIYILLNKISERIVENIIYFYHTILFIVLILMVLLWGVYNILLLQFLTSRFLEYQLDMVYCHV